MTDTQNQTASFPTHAIASLIAREAKLMGYSVRRSAAGPSSRSAYIFCDSIKVRVADHAARGTIDMDVHADMPRPGSLSHREAIAQLRANLSSERLCGLVGKTRPLTLPRANTKVSGMSSKDNTAICPTCNGSGWAWQWRTYGNQQYHGDYYEPCDDCAEGREITERQHAKIVKSAS